MQRLRQRLCSQCNRLSPTVPIGTELVRLMPLLKFFWCFSIFLYQVVFLSLGIISLFRKKSCHGTFAHYLYLSLKHGKVYDDVTPVLYYVLSTPCLVYLLHFTPGGTVDAKRSWRCSSRTSSWRSSLHHRISEEVYSRVVAGGRLTLHLRDTLFGPRLNHQYFFLTYGSPYIYLPHDGGRFHKHLHFHWPTFFSLVRFPLQAPNTRFCVDSAGIHLKRRTSGTLPY